MKKIYFVIISSVLAIAVVIGASRLRAHAQAITSSISLSQLAGSFAGETDANYGRCYNSTFTTLQACSKTPASQVVPWISNSTIQYTSDAAGNSCAELIGANAAASPLPSPAGNMDWILTGSVNSYNPATGRGQIAQKYYVAGPGVSCNGATFVNTAKAPVIVTATLNFVVSQNGNRIDWITLSIAATPVNWVAGFIGHAYLLRQ
jgi:hypothetical protein